MPRAKKTPPPGAAERKEEPTLAPAQAVTATYFDVYNAACLARCTIRLHETGISLARNGDEANCAMFARTKEGYGEAIRWMADFAPDVAETTRAVTEGALFFMLNSLAVPIDIQWQETGVYARRVIGKSGTASSFLDALQQALTALMCSRKEPAA